MSEITQTRDLSDTLLEIGAKLCPRRYRRFRDLRDGEQVEQWARGLDWRDNPYDRFLLRREILRQLESTVIYEPGFQNVYTYASRYEIAAEVDTLMREFPHEYESMGVFSYVLIILPWHLAFRHGKVRRDPLLAALNKLEAKQDTKG